jgi:microcystin degradation protein MlrC
LELIDVNIALGGFIRAAKKEPWELIPVLWAGAGPSGPVEGSTFDVLVAEILASAAAHRPDAIYLNLHGAMVTEHHDDGDGELLRRLRTVVGPAIPIVVSLDLHANKSQLMFDHADALVAYRTYPHLDMAETGERSAHILARILAGENKSVRWHRIPFLIPINSGCTDLEPAKSIYALLNDLGVDSSACPSFAPGFPAADIEDCGPVVWAHGRDADVITRVVEKLVSEITSDPDKWLVRTVDSDEAIKSALQQEANRPVVVADTQDNPGAGGTSRTTGLLRALLAADNGRPAAIGLIHDPQAAAEAHRVGPGQSVELSLGGDQLVPGDEGVHAQWLVEAVSDGRCRMDGPMFHGVWVDAGPSACLRLGSVRVAVTSERVQVIDRNQFRIVGIEPEDQAVVVVKSSVHFRGDFSEIAHGILVAKSPGLVAADPADLTWTKLPASMELLPKNPNKGIKN